jgi:TatA/E family protein of Tat protein translocase
VFGPKKRPELGKGIGEGIRDFESAMKEEEKPANVRPITAGDQG